MGAMTLEKTVGKTVAKKAASPMSELSSEHGTRPDFGPGEKHLRKRDMNLSILSDGTAMVKVREFSPRPSMSPFWNAGTRLEAFSGEPIAVSRAEYRSMAHSTSLLLSYTWGMSSRYGGARPMPKAVATIVTNSIYIVKMKGMSLLPNSPWV